MSKTRRKKVAGQAKPKAKSANKAQSQILYHLMAVLVFAVLASFIYSNTIDSPFFLDDLHNIRENPHIRLTELSLKNILDAGFKSHISSRPVANISFALNYYFHQYNIAGYHYVNIAIHILTATFLYLLLKNTLSMKLLPRKYGNPTLIAFITALLWLVHPLQTQSITYIVQRMNSMAAMFYVLSMLLYVKGRLSGQNKDRSWPWFIGCILAALLAVGTKQIAGTLPLFILLYEWYFFQNLKKSWLKKSMIYVIPLIIFFGVVALCYLGLSPFERIASGYESRQFNMTERLLTQPRVVIFYISLLAFPLPSRLNLDHYITISHSLIDPVTTLICIAAIIGLAVLSIRIAKKQRLLSFCILWFLGNLAIESSFLALELVFEHRLYLPSMLVSLAVVVLIWRYVKNDGIKAVMIFALVVLCSIATYQRNKMWRDPMVMWKDCVAKSPQKARAQTNLGVLYNRTGNFDKALEHCSKAVQLDPKLSRAYYNLGIAQLRKDKVDEAIKSWRKTLELNPTHNKAHNNLAALLFERNNIDEAIEHWTEAVKLNSNDYLAHGNLGYAFSLKGRIDEAIEHYRQSLKLQPRRIGERFRLATLLHRQGKLDEAAIEYRKVLQLAPNHPKARAGLKAILNK